MVTIKQLYKIGPGPSSSHTMGPKNAVEYILKKYPSIDYVKMTFFGSLAFTGKGHLSDYIADKTFGDVKHDIVFDYITHKKHPNTMTFEIHQGNKINKETIISIGGGFIKVIGEKKCEEKDIYPFKKFKDIKKYCLDNNLSLVEMIKHFEEDDIYDYAEKIYLQMMETIANGLSNEGVLPGKLMVKRKAKDIYQGIGRDDCGTEAQRKRIFAYAFAVAEENASGGTVVTAPTCGSAGVLPALVKHAEDEGISHKKILDGILVAGLIGVLVKQNASISGAEAGCQAEIGTASSMGAAFLCETENLGIDKIERASEIAMEHSLGMTCDPIGGYVQIPCIERCAMGAMRSLESYTLCKLLDNTSSKISLDTVVSTMYKTGKDLRCKYKETSEGGLAKTYYEGE
jgi:L-serine dehydratase